jgi:hypothetical protein
VHSFSKLKPKRNAGNPLPRGKMGVYGTPHGESSPVKESVMKAAVSLLPIFSTQKSMTKNLILDDKSQPHY